MAAGFFLDAGLQSISRSAETVSRRRRRNHAHAAGFDDHDGAGEPWDERRIQRCHETRCAFAWGPRIRQSEHHDARMRAWRKSKRVRKVHIARHQDARLRCRGCGYYRIIGSSQSDVANINRVVPRVGESAGDGARQRLVDQESGHASGGCANGVLFGQPGGVPERCAKLVLRQLVLSAKLGLGDPCRKLADNHCCGHARACNDRLAEDNVRICSDSRDDFRAHRSILTRQRKPVAHRMFAGLIQAFDVILAAGAGGRPCGF